MTGFVNAYVIFACLAAWLIVSAWGIANLRGFWRTLFFERTGATITHIWTRRETWSSEAGPDETWVLTNFSYRFEVDGRTYRGDSEDDFIGSYGAIREGDRAVGESVEIFYDPGDPTHCCATRAGFGGGVVIFAIAQLLLAMTVDQIRLAIPEPRAPGVEFVRNDFPLAGSWYGYIDESRIGTYNATLTLHNALPGVPSGRIDYATFGCRTLLSFIETRESRYVYREEHEAGQCMGMKTVELSREADGELRWHSVYEDGTRQGSGRFALRSPR